MKDTKLLATYGYYNYFPLTGGTATVTLEKNYREILIDWMQACNYTTGTELSSNQFTFSNWKHDRNAFSFLYS